MGLLKFIFGVNDYSKPCPYRAKPVACSHNHKTYIDEKGYRRFTDSNRSVHRWVVEKKIGRKLRQNEVVHHINGDKLDDRPENLEVFPNQRQHHRRHVQNKRKYGTWYGRDT